MLSRSSLQFPPRIWKTMELSHFKGETDVSKIVPLLKDTPGIDVRIRKMK